MADALPAESISPPFNLEAALQRNFVTPLADYAQGRTSLAAAVLARRNQLADQATNQNFVNQRDTRQQQFESQRDAAQRQFEADQNEKSRKERLDAIDRAEQMRIAQEAAQSGVSPYDDDGNLRPTKDVLSDVLSAKKQSAKNVLNLYNTQLSDNRQQQADVMKKVVTTLNAKATPEQMRNALRATLDDPVASASLSKDQRAKLESLVNSNADPSAQIHKVYGDMANDYVFSGGAARNRAATFLGAYQKSLVTDQKAVNDTTVALLGEQLNKLAGSQEQIERQKAIHQVSAAPFLSKEDLQDANPANALNNPAGPIGQFALAGAHPPVDPNDLMSGGGAATTTPTPVSVPPVTPLPSVSDAMNERGLIGPGGAVSTAASNFGTSVVQPTLQHTINAGAAVSDPERHEQPGERLSRLSPSGYSQFLRWTQWACSRNAGTAREHQGRDRQCGKGSTPARSKSAGQSRVSRRNSTGASILFDPRWSTG